MSTKTWRLTGLGKEGGANDLPEAYELRMAVKFEFSSWKSMEEPPPFHNESLHKSDRKAYRNGRSYVVGNMSPRLRIMLERLYMHTDDTFREP